MDYALRSQPDWVPVVSRRAVFFGHYLSSARACAAVVALRRVVVLDDFGAGFAASSVEVLRLRVVVLALVGVGLGLSPVSWLV